MAIRPRPLDVEAGTRDAFGDAEARECPMTSEGNASEGHGVRACDRRFGERTTSRAGRERGSSVKSPEGNRKIEILIAFADCLPVRKISVLRIESDRGSHDSPAPVWRLLRLAFRRDPTGNHSTHTGRTRTEEKERSKSLAESGVRFVTSEVRGSRAVSYFTRRTPRAARCRPSPRSAPPRPRAPAPPDLGSALASPRGSFASRGASAASTRAWRNPFLVAMRAPPLAPASSR